MTWIPDQYNAKGIIGGTYVVSKNILHEAIKMDGNYLFEDPLLVMLTGGTQLGLDEARPVLIAREFGNVTSQILQKVS